MIWLKNNSVLAKIKARAVIVSISSAMRRTTSKANLFETMGWLIGVLVN
jgi:hypothetical protein